jgi:hypothetical protein
MSTTKISVTIDDGVLSWLRRRARQIHDGNLSAAVSEAAQHLYKQEALREFLKGEGVPRLSIDELAEIQKEWRRAGTLRARPRQAGDVQSRRSKKGRAA